MITIKPPSPAKKKCTKCGKKMDINEKNFRKVQYGFSGDCRPCSNAYYKKRMKEKRSWINIIIGPCSF